MPLPHPRDVSHFRFGDNWASYARLIDEPAITEAKTGLLKLLPADAIAGRSWLDIGCGSGLHAVAAARLGATKIYALDIDPQCVSTTRNVLEVYAAATPWRAEERSVFDLDPLVDGQYDIVYSWGVLHHTGDLHEAITRAAAMVGPEGTLALALYRRTALDAFWKWEKRWYNNASERAQRRVQSIYVGLFWLASMLKGRNFQAFKRAYRSRRGMDFLHDVHDWLGGYPYQSILAPEVDRLMAQLNFDAVRVFARPREFGLLGSGCDEYVYRRQS